jgi:hypothetical protein
MAVVHRERGFRVIIWPNDHRPAHVHVENGEAEAVFYLGDDRTMPSLRENRRMRRKDLVRALKIVCEQQDLLLQKWREIHG